MKAYPVVPKTFTALIIFLSLFSLTSFLPVSADTYWTGSAGLMWNVNYSSVNTGIGTNAPTGVLQVSGVRKGANNQGQLLVVGASDHAYLQVRSTAPTTKETGFQLIGLGSIANPDWSIKESANSTTLKFNYRGNDNVAFLSNGRVGIGTNTPDASLHVFDGTEAGLTGGGYLITGNHNSYNIVMDTNEISARNGEASSPLYIQALSNSANTYINPGGGSVGIGTNTPDSKLDVEGDLRVGYDTDTKSILGRAAIGAGGGYSDFAFLGHVDRSTAADGYAIMQNSVGQTYVNSSSGYPLDFRIGNVSKMYVGSNGNVGVGITNPTQKLEVNGSIKLYGNIVSDGNICIGECN